MASDGTKLVSVIIPVWNGQETIDRAISSALQQEGVDVEVVVTDDCSTDNTASIVQGFGDSRVRYGKTSKNSGPSAARNLGLATARGAYISVLDADDYFEPGRMQRLVGVLENSDAALVADNMTLLNATTGEKSRYLENCDNKEPRRISLDEYFVENRLFDSRRAFGYMKPVFRADFIKNNNLSYDETLRIGEDFCLVSEIMALGGQFLLVSEPGYVYTIWQTNSTSGRMKIAPIETMIAADNRFREKYFQKLTAKEKDAANLRRRTLDEGLAYIKALNALKARKLVDAGKALAGAPTALRHLKMTLRTYWRRLAHA